MIIPQKIPNNGILLVDKPIGISSFGIVKKVRTAFNVKKVGHAGTLDPLASGLLIILIGKENTKKANQFLKLDKTYEVEASLGQTSSTGDNEGKLKKASDNKPTLSKIKKVLNEFRDEISQIPPIYSALKVKGERSYQLARKGEKPDLAKRKVIIYKIENISYKYPKLNFSCAVSSGTYIRSLVEDIGKKLKTGAFTSQLRRITIGKYNVEDAISLDKIG
ncbi:MAG: tRNA pseudouridine(55) synthase TruB [bacterium]|nr:tRNA pseudouridine(55) synthase TruB [bacterium]